MSKRPIENSELYTYIGKQICEARYQYRVVGGIKKVMTQTQLAKCLWGNFPTDTKVRESY